MSEAKEPTVEKLVCLIGGKTTFEKCRRCGCLVTEERFGELNRNIDDHTDMADAIVQAILSGSFPPRPKP